MCVVWQDVFAMMSPLLGYVVKLCLVILKPFEEEKVSNFIYLQTNILSPVMTLGNTSTT